MCPIATIQTPLLARVSETPTGRKVKTLHQMVETAKQPNRYSQDVGKTHKDNSQIISSYPTHLIQILYIAAIHSNDTLLIPNSPSLYCLSGSPGPCDYLLCQQSVAYELAVTKILFVWRWVMMVDFVFTKISNLVSSLAAASSGTDINRRLSNIVLRWAFVSLHGSDCAVVAQTKRCAAVAHVHCN